jgi:HPt (histidine-containing phosphotransfer) domain-containing protein
MRIPVMIITAESDIKLLSDGMAAGATVLLPKPFTKVRLQRTLRMMLGPNAESKKSSLPTNTRKVSLPDESLQRESSANKAVTGSETTAATPAADQPVNLQVLVDLENGDDDEDLVTELIDLFLENAEREVKAIKTAALERNESSRKERAHALKGSSSTIGAWRVAKLCEQLEVLAEQNSSARIDELVRKLESEFASAREVLVGERRERLQTGV